MGFTHNNIVVSFDKDYKQTEYSELAYSKYITQQIFLKIDEAFEGLMTRDESTFEFPNVKASNYNYMLSYDIKNVSDMYLTVQLRVVFNGNTPLIYILFSYTRDKYDENYTPSQFSNLNKVANIREFSIKFTKITNNYTDGEGITHITYTFSCSFYINIAKNNSMYIFNATETSTSLINYNNEYALFLGVYKNVCISQSDIFSSNDNIICNAIRMLYPNKVKYIQSIMMNHEGCINDGEIIYLPVYSTSRNDCIALRDSTPIETMIDLPYKAFPVDSIITINDKDYLMIGTNFAIEI